MSHPRSGMEILSAPRPPRNRTGARRRSGASTETKPMVSSTSPTKAAPEEKGHVQALYAALPAPEARCLVNRLEWHSTPKHASWLNMAESELAVLTNQCLSRRIPGKPTLEKQVAAWETCRDKRHAKADRQFQPKRPVSN